jgi:transcriptional repressor NrdR
MRCPFCGDGDSQVVDSRLSEAGDAVRRRRRCRACERRFTTYERYDQGPLYIRKRSGGREPFDRAKLMAGLERAAIKRPIEREQLDALVDRIVAEVRSRGGAPSADEVGELALRGLRLLDPVAYVRFASVYRKFDDVAEFEAELQRLESEPPLQAEHLFEPGAWGVPGGGSIRSRGHTALLPPEPGKKGAGSEKEAGSELEDGLVGVSEGNSDSRRGS